MRIRRLEGRSDVLGPVEVRLPGGLVAVVGRDGRGVSAFLRLLRRGLLGRGGEDGEEMARVVTHGGRPGRTPPVEDLTALRMGAGREEDPADVLDASSHALARIRGGARLDEAFTRVVRARGGEEGVDLLARVDPSALRERIEELESAPGRLRELEGKLRGLRADHAELTGEVEVATMEWLRERQDAETHLQAYRDRARELKARLTQLEEAGPESPCPTCSRILKDHFDEVVTELREEWESVVQDGSWWKRRREQLELKPEALRELEGRSLRLQAAMEDCAETVERTRARDQELRTARVRLRELERPVDGDPVGTVPVDDDPAPVLLRAMNALKEEMVEEARERIVEEAVRILLEISGGRILGLSRPDAGALALEGVADRLVDPTPEDRAAAAVALRLGAAVALLDHGGGLPGVLVVAAPFDRMDEEGRLRTVDLLARLVGRIPQILLVTRGHAVELYPEAFDAVLELGSEAGGAGPPVRALAAGLGTVRIG